MVQVKLAGAERLPSLTVTVTSYVAAVVGVPVMCPVVLSMPSPAGNPVAL
jgi:hypothetical protein